MSELQWQHVVLGTKCSWLHGDKRGFRSRKHRIHSSGDYKNPPPRGEHQGLYLYHSKRSGKPVSFSFEIRIRIARSFVLKLQALKVQVIAFSVGAKHAHALLEGPKNYGALKRMIGKGKQRASHDVRDVHPGTVWSEGVKSERIRDKGHFKNAYDYIRTKQEPGTVVWSHRDDEDWVAHESLGVIVMGLQKRRIRVFAKTHSDAGV